MATSSDVFASDPQLVGVHALIVDDDEDVCELLAELLRTFGADVTTAGSGEEAFARFRMRRPDIVISDLHMVGGSGIDLVRQIRVLPPEQGGLTPAIAMSGAARIDEALDAGFHCHFTKPLPMESLLEVVRTLVRGPPTCWSVGIDTDTIVIRFRDHVSNEDMRAMTAMVVSLLVRAPDGYHVVSDLRRVTSFSPSVGAMVQLAISGVRDRIRSVVVVGGSTLARTVSRSICLVLGISCSFTDTLTA